MWVFLVVLILLLIAGLLGVVLKAIAFLVLVGITTLAVLAAAAYFWFRHQLRKGNVRMQVQRGTTRIETGRPTPTQSLPEDPPERDDRY
jgi:membrane protein YdbS with pleckstrin-like domain